MTFTNYNDFKKVINNINHYRQRRNNAKKAKTSLRKFDYDNLKYYIRI